MKSNFQRRVRRAWKAYLVVKAEKARKKAEADAAKKKKGRRGLAPKPAIPT